MLEQREFRGAAAWRMENETLTAVLLPPGGLGRRLLGL